MTTRQTKFALTAPRLGASRYRGRKKPRGASRPEPPLAGPRRMHRM